MNREPETRRATASDVQALQLQIDDMKRRLDEIETLCNRTVMLGDGKLTPALEELRFIPSVTPSFRYSPAFGLSSKVGRVGNVDVVECEKIPPDGPIVQDEEDLAKALVDGR